MRRFVLLLSFFLLAGAGFRDEKLVEIDVAVRDAIAERRLPGGVLLIEHGGERVLRAYGNRALEPRVERMTTDTIFDAASITKVVATAPSILATRSGCSWAPPPPRLSRLEVSCLPKSG